MRKVMGIAAGGSIALGAASLISGLGLGSGAVISGGYDYVGAAPATIALGAGMLVAGINLRADDRRAPTTKELAE